MKRSALIAIAAVALISLPLNATTCIAGETFKVPQVCGTVTDKDGVVIPDARIRVGPKNHPQDDKEVSSDQKGRFRIPSFTTGEYVMTVKYLGFGNAWQLFKVSGSGGERQCTKPIHVVMKPAGQCSYVENAWPDLKRK